MKTLFYISLLIGLNLTTQFTWAKNTDSFSLYKNENNETMFHARVLVYHSEIELKRITYEPYLKNDLLITFYYTDKPSRIYSTYFDTTITLKKTLQPDQCLYFRHSMDTNTVDTSHDYYPYFWYPDTVFVGCDTPEITTYIPSPQNYLYPSWMKDKVHINPEINIHYINIYTTLGTLILQVSSKEKEIDVSDLPSGIYLFYIKTDLGDFTQKMQKE